MKKKVWMSWSTGKDSAYTLFKLKQDFSVEVTGLFTTVTKDFGRVSMHAVREDLLNQQAQELGLPIYPIYIPSNCTNKIYEEEMSKLIREAICQGVTHMAFGDLFLEDVRSYREKQLLNSGISPLFPIWGIPTKDLAHLMIESGIRAVITCIDPRVLDETFAGREFDSSFLEDLPKGIDPCGENGEFHSFVFDSPLFNKPIPITKGLRLKRDGFVFSDVVGTNSQ